MVACSDDVIGSPELTGFFICLMALKFAYFGLSDNAVHHQTLCKDDHILRIHDALMPHKRPSFGFAGLHPTNQITYVIIAASGEDRVGGQ